jgi:hypothetical protein
VAPGAIAVCCADARRHALGATAEDLDVGATQEGGDVTAQPFGSDTAAVEHEHEVVVRDLEVASCLSGGDLAQRDRLADIVAPEITEPSMVIPHTVYGRDAGGNTMVYTVDREGSFARTIAALMATEQRRARGGSS